MKVLNLYAGIGGNRKLWENVEVDAVEINPKIAKTYQNFFKDDTIIIDDAHKYLLEHYNKYDIIWSSPPCPTHSQFRYRCGHIAWNQKPVYPDMKLYEEIVFLKYYFKGKWIVENTESYYEPLIKPQHIARHYFWSNFYINGFDSKQLNIKKNTKEDYSSMHGFTLDKFEDGFDKRKTLRNCVYPELGKHVFDCAFKGKQLKLMEKGCR